MPRTAADVIRGIRGFARANPERYDLSREDLDLLVAEVERLQQAHDAVGALLESFSADVDWYKLRLGRVLLDQPDPGPREGR